MTMKNFKNDIKKDGKYISIEIGVDEIDTAMERTGKDSWLCLTLTNARLLGYKSILLTSMPANESDIFFRIPYHNTEEGWKVLDNLEQEKVKSFREEIDRKYGKKDA